MGQCTEEGVYLNCTGEGTIYSGGVSYEVYRGEGLDLEYTGGG